MLMNENIYKHIIKRVIGWAEKNDTIRAVAAVGSRARKIFPADKWSDLDLAIITDDVSKYITSADWVTEFGNPLLTFIEKTPDESFERRVLYEGFLDIDFAFNTLPELGDENRLRFITSIMKRGHTILVDKDNLFPSLKKADDFHETKKSVEGMLNEIHDYFYHCVWIVKKLMRGEVYTALRCLNLYMNRKLVTIIEEYEKIRHGQTYDTWYNGRFIEQWACPDIINELYGCFSDYDKNQVFTALKRNMALYKRLSRQVARARGFPYPESQVEEVEHWIDKNDTA
jgi:aminoglycoside 6-adenylyltransferase